MRPERCDTCHTRLGRAHLKAIRGSRFRCTSPRLCAERLFLSEPGALDFLASLCTSFADDFEPGEGLAFPRTRRIAHESV